jgi:hypothetical protein
MFSDHPCKTGESFPFPEGHAKKKATKIPPVIDWIGANPVRPKRKQKL